MTNFFKTYQSFSVIKFVQSTNTKWFLITHEYGFERSKGLLNKDVKDVDIKEHFALMWEEK